MRITDLISIELTDKSNLNEQHLHSMLISLSRGLAAIVVAVAHLRSIVFPRYSAIEHPPAAFQLLAFVSGFAHQAVIVFFVLSGWLVGGAFMNKIRETHAIRDYIVDRTTRLWTVLIPILLLTLLFVRFEQGIDARYVDTNAIASLDWKTFLGNLLGVQTMLVLPYGGNEPLWSLANETCYYILFPVVAVAAVHKSTITRLGCATAALAILAAIDTVMMLYFAIWLLGAASSRLRIEAAWRGQCLLFLFFAATAIICRLFGNVDDLAVESFGQDLVFGASFLLLLCSLQYRPAVTPWWLYVLRRTGAVLSGFSFSLYVLHVPMFDLLLALRRVPQASLTPHAGYGWSVFVSTLAATIAFAWLFSLAFEQQTWRLRRTIKQLFSRRDVKTGAHARAWSD